MRKFEGFMKGVNLGGWISQFAEYDIKHFETFITKEDIKYIAGVGFDHVRVPVDYNVLEDEEGNFIASGFEYLKNCLGWCKQYGLHMLIDLHECYGYSFDPLKVDMDRTKFFYDEQLQTRFLRLWAEIAKTFKDDAEYVAFEPLNEVVVYEVSDAWNALVRKYIEMIREICPNHFIVVGGVCYNHVTNVPLLDKPYDDKIVYNFHCYEPFIFTHQGAYWVDFMPSDFRLGYPGSLEDYRKANKSINDGEGSAIFRDDVTSIGPEFFEAIFKVAIDHAVANDAALYCGEYGVIDLAANPDKLRWLKDIHSVFDKYGIGRALWNYKEKDFGIVDEAFADIKDEFMKCL